MFDDKCHFGISAEKNLFGGNICGDVLDVSAPFAVNPNEINCFGMNVTTLKHPILLI